ncbi:hypothetical protein [Dankookia sp. P2]|uniref:hypothetical protein n=1 Tax=Dankookia sp. P2 TaxID=3423955 RepID=UPI003D67B23A
MAQTVFTSTVDNHLLDASALDTTAVLRGIAGSDTLIGGSAADRLDGGLGADLLQGGAGNDQFFVTLGKDLGVGQYDTIEGGTGSDELIITLNSAQLGTAEMKTELARLKTFLADHGSDPTGHFISDVLHVDLSGVESARLRVDGVMKTLADVLPVQHGPITFNDLTGSEGAIPDGYMGFDWKVPGDNMYALDGTTYDDQDSGYAKLAAVTGSIVAYNPYASAPIDIHKTDGSDFIFDKVSAASAWNESQDVVFHGYNNGQLVGELAVTLTNQGPTLVDVDWGAIDDLQIEVLNGDHVTFDNFYMG